MTLGAFLKRHDETLSSKSTIKGAAEYIYSVTEDLWAEFCGTKTWSGRDATNFMFRGSELGDMDIVKEVKLSLSKEVKTTRIDPNREVDFIVGHAIHRMLQERTKNILGVWECKQCHKIYGYPDICLRPEKCECGFDGYTPFPDERKLIGKFRYYEWFVWNKEEHLQGHIDAPILMPSGSMVITDFKTCSKDSAKTIYYDGPNKKDIVQLIAYMFLSGQLNGRLVYINTNKRPNFMMEFDIKPDMRVISEIRERVDYFKRCMEACSVLETKLKPISESPLLKERLWSALTK